MNNVTEKTHELVVRWIAAKRAVERSRESLKAAEVELAIAQNELGKWLIPEGSARGLTRQGAVDKESEPFNIWFGSGILQAVFKVCGNYTVRWFREPDGKDRHEFGV